MASLWFLYLVLINALFEFVSSTGEADEILDESIISIINQETQNSKHDQADEPEVEVALSTSFMANLWGIVALIVVYIVCLYAYHSKKKGKPINCIRINSQKYWIIQFILSVAVLLLVIFAIQENEINCIGAESVDTVDTWFNILNKLSIVILSCSIVIIIYTYINLPEYEDGQDMNQRIENEGNCGLWRNNKLCITAFVFQPLLPMLLLSGTIIEFALANKSNSDCFDEGLNVGVSIICDGVAVLLLIIDVVFHLFSLCAH